MTFGEALGLQLRARQGKGAQVPPISPHSQASKPPSCKVVPRHIMPCQAACSLREVCETAAVPRLFFFFLNATVLPDKQADAL